MDYNIFDIVKTATVDVPVWELCVAFVAITLCLLLKFSRMGLIMAFLFVFHLGWVFVQRDLAPKSDTFQTWAVLYVISGAAIMLLTIASAIMHPPEH